MPFLGDAMLKDAFFSALAVIVVVVLAAVLGPKGPTGPPDPTLAGANPRPEWPFLWLFALLSLSPPAAETFIILVFPVLLIVALFLVPFVQQPRRARPQPPAGGRAVGDRDLHGPRRADLPGGHLALVAGDDGLERRPGPRGHRPATARRCSCKGPLVFQNKNCRNCHALEGIGGRRGPDLTAVGTRLTRDQLIDQVSNGTPGRRQHAGLRQADEPGRDDRPGRFPGRACGRAGQPPARPAATQRDRDDGSTPMSPTLDAFLRSWPFDPWLLAALLLTAGVYLRGWLVAPPPRPAALARAASSPRSWAGWRRSSWPWRRRSSRSPACCCRSTWCSTCCS